ncbi:response regulator [Campylobacter sp. Marseille-Q3452]|uniref:Response regulator n=1 Tax=Campylobacter massiliensis TaxID=2762557 RepID=A0A842JEZ9_9BACT|nr:response regulator [Campylobacter massiliensis]MBC2883604.1 response regulator [Campylobacter massiliensis]
MINSSNNVSFLKLPDIDIARVNKTQSLKETVKVGDESMTSAEYLNRQAQIEYRAKDFLRAQSSGIISKLRVNNVMDISDSNTLNKGEFNINNLLGRNSGLDYHYSSSPTLTGDFARYDFTYLGSRYSVNQEQRIDSVVNDHNALKEIKQKYGVDTSNAYLNGSLRGERYFQGINADPHSINMSFIDQSGYLENTKSSNLNSYASSSTLHTKYGDVEVFLDLYGDNDKLGIGKFSSNAILFNFDSNGDGILNSSDKLFSKLKVRGYDKDGNEKIANLSDVVSDIDLTKFINSDVVNWNQKRRDIINSESLANNDMRNFVDTTNIDHRISYYSSNPYAVFAPESRYKKIESDGVKNFFDAYADKDGWVDLRNNNVFNKNSLFNNFAYEKVGFDGKLKLSEFNPIIGSDAPKDKDFSYNGYQRSSFMKFYGDYNKELDAHNKDIEWLSKNLKDYNVENADELISKLSQSKSAYMVAMENEFEAATGLKFSEENLEKVRRAFETDIDRAASSLRDSDSVIAMKLNDNGSITLKFDSGREIEVTELYSDTGKLLGDKTRRASLNLETKAMSDIELGSISFNNIGILDTDGKYKTLQEIGASAIKSFSTKHGKQFLIYLGDNKTLTAKDLYNISFLNNELDKGANVGEKDRFYKKIDVRV